MKYDLGKRIKYFRERALVSQLDLEVQTESSAGTISRIENNKINPTKETILKISEALNLNNKELDYLIGKTSLPPTQYEIQNAVKEVKEYFALKGKIAYLIDERWSIWSVSKTLMKLMGINDNDVQRLLGINGIRLLIDEKTGIFKKGLDNFREDFF